MGVDFRRVSARASSRGTGTLQHGTMPAHLRAPRLPVVTGPVRKTRALPMTGAMRSGDGTGPSDWTRSASIGGTVGSVIRDSRWSQTVQNRAC